MTRESHRMMITANTYSLTSTQKGRDVILPFIEGKTDPERISDTALEWCLRTQTQT